MMSYKYNVPGHDDIDIYIFNMCDMAFLLAAIASQFIFNIYHEQICTRKRKWTKPQKLIGWTSVERAKKKSQKTKEKSFAFLIKRK